MLIRNIICLNKNFIVLFETNLYYLTEITLLFEVTKINNIFQPNNILFDYNEYKQ